jgi:indole-3-glycerol phosphate synthase
MHICRHLSNLSLADLELSDQVAAVGERPRHILEEIVWHKKQEVAQLHEQITLADLQSQLNDAPRPLDL